MGGGEESRVVSGEWWVQESGVGSGEWRVVGSTIRNEWVADGVSTNHQPFGAFRNSPLPPTTHHSWLFITHHSQLTTRLLAY